MSLTSLNPILDELWSPVAALTAAHGARANGLITSTAVTASLLPESPRLAVTLGRASLTHELVLASGAFALHLLPAEPLEPSLTIFRTLGFRSGHDGEKLTALAWHPGATGAPLLEHALAYVEARVAGSLAADDVTLVLADVVDSGRLREGRHMTIDDVRAHLSADDWTAWEARLDEELRAARALR